MYLGIEKKIFSSMLQSITRQMASSGKTGQIGINVADPNVGYLLAVQQESAFAKNDINSLRCSHHN